MVDFAIESLWFAIWRVAKYKIKLERICSPDIFLETRHKYDAILLIDVLEHIPNYENVLKKLAKRVRVFAISAPFKDPKVFDEWHPQHLYQQRSINEIMKELGFYSYNGLYWVKG